MGHRLRTKAIAYEDNVLRRLQGEGFSGTAADLRSLAEHGEVLRKRYENACNYQWATTDAYNLQTDRMEQELKAMASGFGLSLYLQTDPRGATVYVRPSPLEIRDNAYNSDAVCLYFAMEEQDA